MAIDDLIDHIRSLESDNVFAHYMLQLSTALFTRSDDLVELSHWKASLITLSKMAGSGRPVFQESYRNALSDLERIYQRKRRQLSGVFDKIWNPNTPFQTSIGEDMIDKHMLEDFLRQGKVYLCISSIETPL